MAQREEAARQFPTTLVLFGVTGDLAARKILPALWRLWSGGRLPRLWHCVGVSRRAWSDTELRSYLSALFPDEARVEDFLSHFSYQRVDFHQLRDYRRLGEKLGYWDGAWRACANKLFYLAVPPSLYEPMLRRLDASGLAEPCGPGEGWTRVIVEKPFGDNEKTAKQLDRLLGRLFQEEQIYRIDHYLGKEILQNILTFRFANSFWQAGWSDETIAEIHVRVWEKVGVVPDRADSFDEVGAFRDVGQNHLLQMLALVTMDDPDAMGAGAVRSRRAEILSALKPYTPAEVRRYAVRGQYLGYRDLPGVMKDSQTETYFKVRAVLDHPRWRQAKITLESGKALAENRKEIEIVFREPRSCFCPDGTTAEASRLVFSLEPAERISFTLWVKKPGLTTEVEARHFHFELKDEQRAASFSQEYERLLDDCVSGNQSLFVSTAEIEAAWRFIDPIISTWKKGVPLTNYPVGAPGLPLEVVSRTAPVLLDRSIGLIGLGKMGGALAEHLLDQGWRVVGWNRTAEVADQLAARGMTVAADWSQLAAALPAPRVIWLMLPAGRLIDQILFDPQGLGAQLSPGDVIIDGGNSDWKDTVRRAETLKERGLQLVDVGVSGGPAGARWGACLMIGGDERVVSRLQPLWHDLAAEERAARYLGAVGAGHYAKMVHNAIEYGQMQAIAEGATLLHSAPFPYRLPEVFDLYNHGSVIQSQLVGLLAEGLRHEDAELRSVSAQVGHTGETAWAVRTAQELSVETPVIKRALEFRLQSRRHSGYTGRVLTLLRRLFGGHDSTVNTSRHDKL